MCRFFHVSRISGVAEFGEDFRCRLESRKLGSPYLEAGLGQARPGGSDPIGDGGDTIVATRCGDEGAVHANICRDAGHEEVGYALASEGEIKRRSVELVVGVAPDDQFPG